MCSRETLNNITDTIKHAAVHLFPDSLERIILYGSYARGEEASESDVDILVLVDMSSSELASYQEKISRMASRLSLETEDCITISIMLQDADTYKKYEAFLPFYRNIAKEGIVIYAA